MHQYLFNDEFITCNISAEQQAATVAELVQVTAQREAHRALVLAHRYVQLTIHLIATTNTALLNSEQS